MTAVRKKDGAHHPKWYTPIPVAFHWKKLVKAALDQDVRLGIIEKVPQGETSEWCSRMVITPKKFAIKPKHPKNSIQEYCQAAKLVLPKYETEYHDTVRSYSAMV